jgi:hypothetical protein
MSTVARAVRWLQPEMTATGSVALRLARTRNTFGSPTDSGGL